MGFCSILTLARVDVGNVVKMVKIWKVLLLEVFLLVGFLTELCLYMFLKRGLKPVFFISEEEDNGWTKVQITSESGKGWHSSFLSKDIKFKTKIDRVPYFT